MLRPQGVMHICARCGQLHSRWKPVCDCCHYSNLLEPINVPNPKSKVLQTLKKIANVESFYPDDDPRSPTYVPPDDPDETEDDDDRDDEGDVESRNTGAVALRDVEEDATEHVPTGIDELDLVLCGGVVLGGTYLLGGDPGVGKSTLLLQALASMSKQGHKTIYVSGEETAGQIKARAKRLGASPKNLFIYAETDLQKVTEAIYEHEPDVVIVDSAQTLRDIRMDSAAGSIAQVIQVTKAAVKWSHDLDTATFIIGHVNKEGTFAGPKTFEHLVDATLSFEGERTHAFRTLRAPKHRFGSSQEVGIFEMGPKGMRGVTNPSEVFLRDRARGVPGSVTAAASDGNRTMLVEVQALVVPMLGAGNRQANGIDPARLPIILSMLEQKVGLQLSKAQVFVNVIGGMKLLEPAMDLPVAMAIVSSATGKIFPEELVAFGEIGLAGEIRGAPKAEARFKEAQAMKFKGAMAGNTPEKTTRGFKVQHPKTLVQALSLALGSRLKMEALPEAPKKVKTGKRRA